MKANKKVLGAAAALTMSLAMAAGSTFAWFTTGNKVKIESFNVKVTTGNDALLVSAGEKGKGSPYVNELSVEDLMYYNGYAYDASGKLYEKYTGTYDEENDKDNVYYQYADGKVTTSVPTTDWTTGRDVSMYYYPVTLDAVTPKLAGTNLAASDINGQFYGKNTDPGSDTSKSAGKYFTFNLNFRMTAGKEDGGSDDVAYGLYFLSDKDYKSEIKTSVQNSKFVNYTGKTNKAASTYGKAINKATWTGDTLTTATKVSSYAAYATRVGFKGKGVWAPYDYEYTSEVPNGCVDTERAEQTAVSYWKGNFAADYNKAITLNNGWDDTGFSETGRTKILNTITAATSDSNSGATELATFTNSECSITFYVWIEGTDGDCFNAILEDTLSIALNFVAHPTT